MSETLSFTQEIIETTLGECFKYRQKEIKEIKGGFGPPDLCHIIKSTISKKSRKIVGFYHQVIGVDTSNLASIASYFGRLINSQEKSKIFHKSWSVLSGTYCVYNAFSRIDFHVHFLLPGKFHCYFLDSKGNKLSFEDLSSQIALRISSKNREIENISKNSFLENNINNNNNSNNNNANQNIYPSGNEEDKFIEINFEDEIKILITNIIENSPKKNVSEKITQNIDMEKIQSEIWEELYLSSLLRFSEIRKINIYKYFPVIKIVKDIEDTKSEQKKIEIFSKMFFKGKNVGCSHPRLMATNGDNLLIKALKNYFFQTFRFKTAIKFFSQFLDQEPEISIPLSKAHLKLGHKKRALSIIRNAFKKNKNSIPLIIQYSKLLAKNGFFQKALNLTKKLVSVAPYFPDAFLILAKIEMRMKNYHGVFTALNSIPFEQNNNLSSNKILHTQNYFPFPTKIVFPNKKKYKINTEYLNTSQNKKSIKNHQSTIFSEKFPGTSIKNHLEKKIYSILVDLSNSFEWQKIMDFKSQVFLNNIRSSNPQPNQTFGEYVEYNFDDYNRNFSNRKNRSYKINEKNNLEFETKSQNNKTNLFDYHKNQIEDAKQNQIEIEIDIDIDIDIDIEKTNENFIQNLSENSNKENLLSNGTTETEDEDGDDYNKLKMCYFDLNNFLSDDFADFSSDKEKNQIKQNQSTTNYSKIKNAPTSLIIPNYLKLECQLWFEDMIKFLNKDLKKFQFHLQKIKKFNPETQIEVNEYSAEYYEIIGDFTFRLKNYTFAKKAYSHGIRVTGSKISDQNIHIFRKLIILNSKRGTAKEVFILANRLKFFLDNRKLPFVESMLFKQTFYNSIFRIFFRFGSKCLDEMINTKTEKIKNSIAHPKILRLISQAKSLQIDEIER
ncbi:bud site selection protein [Anaeramoeba ignava]|uniref:Bud site selection protein n=1 Tax=Anaeramoeba ignava TaxID=1746090 RepID=A0A9Q0LQP6_ANAIG|nr:bud site selection protein [Anaeramoeba ignava]